MGWFGETELERKAREEAELAAKIEKEKQEFGFVQFEDEAHTERQKTYLKNIFTPVMQDKEEIERVRRYRAKHSAEKMAANKEKATQENIRVATQNVIEAAKEREQQREVLQARKEMVNNPHLVLGDNRFLNRFPLQPKSNLFPALGSKTRPEVVAIKEKMQEIKSVAADAKIRSKVRYDQGKAKKDVRKRNTALRLEDKFNQKMDTLERREEKGDQVIADRKYAQAKRAALFQKQQQRDKEPAPQLKSFFKP